MVEEVSTHLEIVFNEGRTKPRSGLSPDSILSTSSIIQIIYSKSK